MKAAEKHFIDLVEKINTGKVSRSENDLTRHLANALEAGGLACVVDTSPQASRGRPDILGYREKVDADLALAAEVVVEAKKPDELARVGGARAGMVDGFWEEKTFEYVAANIARIQVFCLTSFVEFGFVRITSALRAAFRKVIEDPDNESAEAELKEQVWQECEILSLEGVGSSEGSSQANHFIDWLRNNLRTDVLSEIPLSEVSNSLRIESGRDLEAFASRLAEIVAGPEGSRASRGMFAAVRSALPVSYEALDAEAQRDLHLFAMSQNPSADLESVQRIVEEEPDRWLDEFVASSVHSLVSRLFVLNAIEDIYCVGEKEPLIEEGLWVINAPAYDGKSAEDMRNTFEARLRELVSSENAVVRRLAVFGAFFDWILPHLPPREFKALFELFVVYDFTDIEGDLLGRFFELYAQRMNKRKRKALGQYYTPLPVVRFMWHTAMEVIEEAASEDDLTVLDPGMGSGTFLREGAKTLAERSYESFWERLVGFDIAPQVMGIAEANLYMAVLAQLEQDQAGEVEDLELYNTDTLDPRNGQFLKQLLPLFSDERHREFLERSADLAGEVKKQEQFRLVIGNPPYKNNSRLTLNQVAERFPALLQSSADASRAQERNIRDDYAWFFCAADAYVGKRGVVCFISSYSYTFKWSYRFFREELLKRYRIRSLALLGTRVFEDVSPRITFAVIACERRPSDLGSAEQCEAIPVYDLSPLEQEGEASVLGTDEDPRFELLDGVVAGERRLPKAVKHVPRPDHGFAMLPISEDLVGRVLESSAPVYKKQGSRIFLRKWPGVITALDGLLKGDERDELGEKVAAFFAIARKPKITTRRMMKELEGWAETYGVRLREQMFERLVYVAQQVKKYDIRFDPKKLKRSVSGSMSNEIRWYPPVEYWHWIYYEPAIKIPRNVNPGKAVGWGSMEQWREPESHEISPKLIFTTSANPKYGYKAFVVDDEWYVKLHGGTSQQYNYTGLVDPTETLRSDGVENNLAGPGEQARKALLAAGGSAEDLLHLIAGIYNSRLAEEFMSERSGHDLQIRLPSEGNVDQCLEIAAEARRLRDLSRFQCFEWEASRVSERSVGEVCAPEYLVELGAKRVKGSGSKKGKMKPGRYIDLQDDLSERVEGAIEDGQDRVDTLVEALYE